MLNFTLCIFSNNSGRVCWDGAGLRRTGQGRATLKNNSSNAAEGKLQTVCIERAGGAEVGKLGKLGKLGKREGSQGRRPTPSPGAQSFKEGAGQSL